MDKKAILIKVRDALLEQGCQSIDEDESDGLCKYRLTMPDGRVIKCGIGHLINDDQYSEELEGEAVYKPIVLLALIDSGIDIPDESDEEKYREAIQFLNDLQKIHDYCEPEYWADEFEKLQKEYNLC